MFIVQTTWQGKRHSHSWLTCVSPFKNSAEQQCALIQEANASHRIYEISESSFPIFFVMRDRDYEHMSSIKIQELLASAPAETSSDDVLFNVYVFEDEYHWRSETMGNSEKHFHITSESLLHYRNQEGTLWECIASTPET